MSNDNTSPDYPTYDDVINTPRPTKMWQPFLPNGRRSKAALVVANGTAWLGLLLIGAFNLGIYIAALSLINLGRDAMIGKLPGCATIAITTGLALKLLATVASAWLLKMSWDSMPYLISKLREECDEAF